MRSVAIWTEKSPDILVVLRFLEAVAGYVTTVDTAPVSNERFLVLSGGYWVPSDTETGTVAEIYVDSGYVRVREA